MKTTLPLWVISFLIITLPLSAQENTRSFAGRLYAEGQLGLFIADGYLPGSIHAGAGYRFSDHHSLGLACTGFGQATTSTNRSATGLGLQYRYQTNGWLFDAAAGLVTHFNYTDNSPFEHQVLLNQSDRRYFRLGIQRRLGRVVTLGVSYAQSGDIIIELNDRESTPPRIFTNENFGPQAFTVNLGFLVQ